MGEGRFPPPCPQKSAAASGTEPVLRSEDHTAGTARAALGPRTTEASPLPGYTGYVIVQCTSCKYPFITNIFSRLR